MGGVCRETGVVSLGGWLGGDIEAILGRKWGLGGGKWEVWYRK